MKEDNIKKLIDFSLEITQGCQFNCTGCTIDKVHNDYPSDNQFEKIMSLICLLYTSPSPRDNRVSRMPSSA